MKLFRRCIPFFAAFLCIALGTYVYAQKMTVHLDPAQTEIHWTLTDTLHTVHGTFKLKGGMLTFDPKTGIAEGEMLVDANSGDSGWTQRDKAMKKQVLEVARYPLVFFHPAKIAGEPKPGNTQDVTLDGTFNIHGADHPLRMGVKVQVDGGRIIATTHFVVPYVDWGLKDPSNVVLKVGKQVSVDVVAHGTIEGLQN